MAWKKSQFILWTDIQSEWLYSCVTYKRNDTTISNRKKVREKKTQYILRKKNINKFHKTLVLFKLQQKIMFFNDKKCYSKVMYL